MTEATANTVVKKRRTNFFVKSFFLSLFKNYNRLNMLEVVYTRLVYSLVLVLFTYNPIYSMYHWIQNPEIAMSSRLAVGVLTAIVWVVYVSLSRKALGIGGIVGTVLALGVSVWWLVDHQLIDFHNMTDIQWLVPILISLVFAIGTSASIFVRRLTGMLPTDDVDTE